MQTLRTCTINASNDHRIYAPTCGLVVKSKYNPNLTLKHEMLYNTEQQTNLSSLKNTELSSTPVLLVWLHLCWIRSTPRMFCSAVRGTWDFLTMRRWRNMMESPQLCSYTKNFCHLLMSEMEKHWKINQMKLMSLLFIELWSSKLCPSGCELWAWCSCPERHFLNINNIFHTGLGEDASSSQITGRTTSPAASPLATVHILHQASNDLFASVTFSSRSIS